ncbi:MAG: deoxyribodipyrimidine photo-lyase [Gammaproteobacteria bacterium]|nr:deoxyribodipyrimidine photo-lyase [Gammaproteobacteria bacterium]
MEIELIWFRRNLRLNNNPIFNNTLIKNKTVLALYIDEPEQNNPWKAGSCSRWWLHYSLQQLQQSLSEQCIPLNYYQSDSMNIFQQLHNNYTITSISFVQRYEPYERKLEQRLINFCIQHQIKINIYNDRLISNPELVLNKQDKPYRVFTAFYKKVLASINSDCNHYPINNINAISDKEGLSLEQLHLLENSPWHHKLQQYWQPGEVHAQEIINEFIDKNLNHYDQMRDYPSDDATSKLSASLHFGEVSVQNLFGKIDALSFLDKSCTVSAQTFIKQLLWREFAAYLLWHFPQSTDLPMNNKFTMDFWQKEGTLFHSWTLGNTGIPLVDAGMQQLWQSGWMHNRVRMITASILTKNMGVSWLSGARWFWDTLVDADLANNTMGWQWVAGCGVDAAPYFRIFNPQAQTEKFDSKHQYINQWCPEKSLNPVLIDLKASRQQALDRYTHNL